MISFLSLFREYIAYYRDTNDPQIQKKKITIDIYVDKYNVLVSFLQEKNILKLSAKDFSETLAQNYWEWLGKYSQNYAIRLIEICSSVLDFGVQKKYIKHNPIIYFKKKRQRPKAPPYLSESQIRLYEEYRSDSSTHQKACDMFVIVLHTGFDYGDFGEFDRDQHMREYKCTEYIIKPRHKPPHVMQVIPVSQELKRRLEKHAYKIKLLSNPTFNEYIKLVADELGMHLRPKVKDGRKIFMMNKLNNEEYSMEATSGMGGHKTTRTTEAFYAQVNIERIHREVKNKASHKK